jgi:hypothetical protein
MTKNGVRLVGPAQATDIDPEIVRIRALKLDGIKALWRETFKGEVPAGLTRDAPQLHAAVYKST